MPEQIDWYSRRDELEPGMIFIDRSGDRIMLDRRVPGDETRWHVADWWGGAWAWMETTIEPGDLVQHISATQAE